VSVSQKVKGINDSLKDIRNETNQLYGKIAYQLNKVFTDTMKTINQTRLSVIVNNIMNMFGTFPKPPVPPAPPGYSTFKQFIETTLKNGIFIDESTFFNSNSWKTFDQYVIQSPEFNFIDTLISNISIQITNVWKLVNITEQVISSDDAVNSIISRIRLDYDNCSNYITRLEKESNDFDEKRSEILQMLQDLTEIIDSNKLSTETLNNILINEKNLLLILISKMETESPIQFNSFEKEIEREMIESIDLLISKIIFEIERSINSIFNGMKDSNISVDDYFSGFYSVYLEDIMSFIDMEFWGLLEKTEINIIHGCVIVESIHPGSNKSIG